MKTNCCFITILFLMSLRTRCILSNKETEAAILNYMTKYAPVGRPRARVEGSSSNGNFAGTSKSRTINLEKSPLVMEQIVSIQRSGGLQKTGVIDKSVIERMNMTRCGMADEVVDGSAPAAYTAHSKWESNYNMITKVYELSYSFFPSTFPSSISKDDIIKGITAAMCMWELNSRIRFHRQIHNSKKADVTVSFGRSDHGDSFNFDGRGGTLAHAFYPENGRIHFDSDEIWYLAVDQMQQSARDIFTVAVHELGHTIGLGHSNVDGSLMQPVYRFTNPFNDYVMPIDDISGIANMYGRPSPSANPLREPYSACRDLYNEYRTTLKMPSNIPTGHVPVTPRPTKKTIITKKTPIRTPGRCEDTRTAETCKFYMMTFSCDNRSYQTEMKNSCPKTCGFCGPAKRRGKSRGNFKKRKKAKSETETDDKCQDDEILGKNCKSWRRQGFCSDSQQGPPMSRLCKKTCNFCRKAQISKPSKVPGMSKTICDFNSFDYFVTIYDSTKIFHAYAFKNLSYFPLQIELHVRDETLSLLNQTRYIQPDLQWRYDPKTVAPGVFKLGSSGLFKDVKSIQAILWAAEFYLIFNKDGIVSEYQRNGPRPRLAGKSPIQALFPRYPHSTVDAAYSERTGRSYSYLIFYKDKFWRFKENHPTVDVAHTFTMEADQQDIYKWRGVHACNLDAVFTYKGVPYFLKGNTFWPADATHDGDHRDITYNFFRCWQSEPTEIKIYIGCESSSHALSIQPLLFHLIFVFTLYIFNLSFF